MRLKSTLVVILFLPFMMSCSSDSGETETVAIDTKTTEPEHVLLTGDVSAAYTNGRFVIWTPKPKEEKEETSGAVSMMVQMDDSINIIAEAPIAEDGTFSLTTEVVGPTPVSFYVLDAVSPSGMRWAPTKGQQFILEPGELTLTMDQYRGYVIVGGYFNDAVFNSWKLSEEYVALQQDYNELRTAPENETEEEQMDRIELMTGLSNGKIDQEIDSRRDLSLNHEDPQVRKLVLQTSWIIGDWYRESLIALQQDLPDDAWVNDALESANASYELKLEASRIAIGTPILDFIAENLDGTEVSLDELQHGKSLVLLEFWASWCGPCRVEIPHMKKAYERFKDKGFEIVSFTIDDSREDWEEASEEEKLPWPNLGMGPAAEAATKYSVTGVPNNYLFDAESGTIIAKDLRGAELDEALEDKLL